VFTAGLAYMNKIAGINLGREEIISCVTKMGLEVLNKTVQD
jgi:phenylalanyl-tRNA synthetase beta subunit